MKITRFSNLSEARYPVSSLTKENRKKNSTHTQRTNHFVRVEKKNLKFNHEVKKVIL